MFAVAQCGSRLEKQRGAFSTISLLSTAKERPCLELAVKNMSAGSLAFYMQCLNSMHSFKNSALADEASCIDIDASSLVKMANLLGVRQKPLMVVSIESISRRL